MRFDRRRGRWRRPSRAAAARLAGVLSGACLAGALAACAPRPVPAPAAAGALSSSAAPQTPRTCNLEGCCEGHGEVAVLQPDRLVQCTDGQISKRCDCH